jgi:hypothetical protein
MRWGEHSVILTLLVAVVDTVQTPDRRCRDLWHSGAPTAAGCSPHTTPPPRACGAHDPCTGWRMRCPHGPTESPRGGALGQSCGPGAQPESPNKAVALCRLRRPAPAYVSSPPGRGLPGPDRAGAWWLRPTRRPALRRPRGRGPPAGGPGRRGRHRAPDGLGEPGPGRVALATRLPHRRRPGARALPASRQPLGAAGGPRRVAPPGARDAHGAHGRGAHQQGRRRASPAPRAPGRATRRSLSSRAGATAKTGRPSAAGCVRVCLRSRRSARPLRSRPQAAAVAEGPAGPRGAAAWGPSCGMRPPRQPTASASGESPRPQSRQAKAGRARAPAPPIVSTRRGTGVRAFQRGAPGGPRAGGRRCAPRGAGSTSAAGRPPVRC